MKLIDLPERYISDAGYIQNLVEEQCGGVGLIVSLAGSVRGNHYHRQDYHYLYVVDGTFRYYYRKGSEVLTIEVRAGQMLYTPPLEAHAQLFLEDTVLISISKLPRTHESHEDDVVRLETPLC